MGMYTEIFFRAEVDEYAFNIIRSAIDEGRLPADDGHPFFTKPRAEMVFTGGGAYFPGARHSIAEHEGYHQAYYVSFRADLKNYDGEIEAFFDWVTPHVAEHHRGFIGYSLYEEFETPTLYYATDEQP